MDFLSEVQRAEASYRESGRPPTGPPPIPLPADTAVALPPEANGRRTRWTINQSSLQTLERDGSPGGKIGYQPTILK